MRDVMIYDENTVYNNMVHNYYHDNQPLFTSQNATTDCIKSRLFFIYFYLFTRKFTGRANKRCCVLFARCGVSLVSSYAVCFFQRSGVSLALSAIIYNIVKVKVTR